VNWSKRLETNLSIGKQLRSRQKSKEHKDGPLITMPATVHTPLPQDQSQGQHRRDQYQSGHQIAVSYCMNLQHQPFENR
jgi:hypothetical protein